LARQGAAGRVSVAEGRGRPGAPKFPWVGG
jgi:hypothetical protein